MGLTGDSICIKSDFSFERIENLKEGDLLLNPENGKVTKVKKIETFYSQEGYIFKTDNFFEVNVSKDTFLKTSSLDKINDKFILKDTEYIKPTELNKLSFLNIPKFKTTETKKIEELILYSKLVLKGTYDKETEKCIFNNFKEEVKDYIDKTKKRNFNVINNKDLKKIYINEMKDFVWLKELSLPTNKRKLEKNLFNINKKDIELFFNEFLKENYSYFQNKNNYRIYTSSKMIVVQLFYLLLWNFNITTNVEKIKKELWKVKKTKSSNKKNKYSITCHDKIKKLIEKENSFYQQITFFDKNNRNLKYYKIYTENNEPFIVYNMIIKEI